MHYYVKYFLNDEEYRIKHFEVNDEEKQMIKDFIKQIEADGYTNFCVKRSLTPMVSLTKLPGILPFLNVKFNILTAKNTRKTATFVY